jgi:hypothetical protein
MIIGSLEFESLPNNVFKVVDIMPRSNESFSFSLLFPPNQLPVIFNSHYFHANNISSLSHFIQTNSFTIAMASQFLSDMYILFQHLHESGYSISYIDPHDIIVVENITDYHSYHVSDHSYPRVSQSYDIPNHPHNRLSFLFSNYNKLYKVTNNIICVTECYKRNSMFIPPEFITNETIPFYCNRSSAYYSLVQIILHCFKQSNRELSSYSFMDILNYYKDTKMYFTLKFSLHDDPNKREFVLF